MISLGWWLCFGMPAYAGVIDLSDRQLPSWTAIAPTTPQPITIASNLIATKPAQISEAEIKQFLQQSETAANQRDIEKMLAAFVPDATVSFTSEDGEKISLSLAEYRRVLEDVFLGYDYYRNMIVVEFVNVQGDRANVGGSTYEKINYSHRPINGVSKWQATVVRQGKDLRFTEVNSYIARAIPR